MSIKKQAFLKAIRIIEQRAQDDKLRSAEHEAEIRQKLPAVFEFRKELSLTALSLSKTILESGDNIQEKIEELKQRNLFIQNRIGEELEENGYPRDYLTLKYECSDCKDTGFVGNQKCGCLKALESKIMAEGLNACCALSESRFDNFSLDYYCKQATDGKLSPYETMSKIFNYCQHYADTYSNDSDSILMFGSTGLGKTHLSLAIAGKVIEKGYSVLYSSAQEYLRIIEDEHFGRCSNDSDTLDELMSVDLLIIDDLGVEFSSEFNVATIYNIINTRLNLSRPTIISTNLSANEIERRYSSRTVSRLFTGYTCLRCEGNDIRVLKAKNKRKS